MKRIGVIGAGNMGSAILHGVLDASYVKPELLYVYDKSYSRMEALSTELRGVSFCESAQELASICDVIIMAVKPYIMKDALQEIYDVLDPSKSVVSIAAGWTVQMLDEALQGSGAGYMRVMPNTPAMIGEGMTAICAETTLQEDDFQFAKGVFDAVGRTVVLHENLFDGVIAISGSSPAYVYMMIEAMADAGVAEGLPRACAYEMAAQAVLGSALMVLQSGEHPGKLKDAVCSPSGTTIDAVIELERKGFRSAIMDAMHACAEKSRSMSK